MTLNKDEHHLVLRSKNREYSTQQPRRSLRIRNLSTTDEDEIALKAHQETVKQLAQVYADLQKDIDEWKQEDEGLMEETSDATRAALRAWLATTNRLLVRFIEFLDRRKTENVSWAEIGLSIKEPQYNDRT